MGLPEQDPSPEEILLRLIKEGKKSSQQLSQQPETAAFADSEASPAESIAAPAPLILRSIPSHISTQNFFWDLHLAPQILLVLSVILGSAVAFNSVRDRRLASERLDMLWASVARPQITMGQALSEPAVTPAPEVLPPKDLFKFTEEPPAATAAGPAHISLDQVLANYSLSGIVGGDQPQAIIEDKKQGKTFFLKAGDTLGEIRIVAVQDGKVIVAIGDEKAELDI